MPEQAEWVGDTLPATKHTGGDDDDYSYAWTVTPVGQHSATPAQVVDVRTADQKFTAAIAALQTTVNLLAETVRDQGVENRKLTERVAHMETWVHKLLNPNGDE